MARAVDWSSARHSTRRDDEILMMSYLTQRLELCSKDTGRAQPSPQERNEYQGRRTSAPGVNKRELDYRHYIGLQILISTQLIPHTLSYCLDRGDIANSPWPRARQIHSGEDLEMSPIDAIFNAWKKLSPSCRGKLRASPVDLASVKIGMSMYYSEIVLGGQYQEL